MTDDRLTRRLPDLMHDLAGTDDRYIDDILARTAQTRQRPAWAFPTRWVPAPATLERLPAHQNRLVVVLLLVAMLALLVGTAAFVGVQIRDELPSSGPTNGWIAVSANPWSVDGGEAGDIYMLQEGAPARRIIGSEDDGVAQACPRFSPDGRKLAYGEATSEARTPGRRDVWPVEDRAVVVVEVDENGEPSSPILRVPLPTDRGEMACPEWSPSGEQLAFRSDTELWVIDSASGHRTVYPVNRATGEQGFEWSRDGSRIAVAEIGHIRVVAVDGTDSRAIPVSSTSPRSLGWVAGNRIVYMAPPGTPVMTINFIDLDANNETQLARGDADVWFHDPAVSRDGTRIAYVQETHVCTKETDGQSCSRQPQRVLVVAADGSDVVELPLAPGFDGAYNLLWSPDGKRILFVSADVVISVPLSPNSAPIVYSTGELNVEWSASEVTWQPVFP